MNKERLPGEETAPDDSPEDIRPGERQLGDGEPQPDQPDDPNDPARRRNPNDQPR